MYCNDEEDCAAFSHSTEYSRCALWMDNHYAPGIDGFETFESSYSWEQTMEVTQGSGNTAWVCYLKDNFYS
jgi:hypothetical protein